MITLLDALRFQAHIFSQEISRIKLSAVKAEVVTAWVYVNKETHVVYGKTVPKDVKPEDVAWREMTFTKIVDHINPKHENWEEYLWRKHEVTRIMIAIRMAKVHNWGIGDHVPLAESAKAACKNWYDYRPGKILGWMKKLNDKIKKGKYRHEAEVLAFLEKMKKAEGVLVA
jgi:hypothetical protein